LKYKWLTSGKILAIMYIHSKENDMKTLPKMQVKLIEEQLIDQVAFQPKNPLTHYANMLKAAKRNFK